MSNLNKKLTRKVQLPVLGFVPAADKSCGVIGIRYSFDDMKSAFNAGWIFFHHHHLM